jgi:hypothetical protein
MGEAQPIEREWLIGVAHDEVRIRCHYLRRASQIVEYTVQLEICQNQSWRPILRYDNAHGFCHCDTIHADGSQDKIPIYRGDANFNFTWAIQEIRAYWQYQTTRYLAELRT